MLLLRRRSTVRRNAVDQAPMLSAHVPTREWRTATSTISRNNNAEEPLSLVHGCMQCV